MQIHGKIHSVLEQEKNLKKTQKYLDSVESVFLKH